MEVNLAQVNNQAKQLRDQAGNLRNVRSLLSRYHDDLRAHWRGEDMRSIGSTISNYSDRLNAIVADLESIGSSLTDEAKAILRTK